MVGRILAVAASTDFPIFFIHPVSSLNSSESFVMISAIISFFFNEAFFQYLPDIRFLVKAFSSDVRIRDQSPVPMVLQASFGDAEGQAYLLCVESLFR